MASLNTQTPFESLNQYGKRLDGSNKESGFLGEIRMPNGRDVMTEVSLGRPDIQESAWDTFRPAIINGMHPADLNYLLQTGNVSSGLEAASLAHALQRIESGKSPFWNSKEDSKVVPTNK